MDKHKEKRSSYNAILVDELANRYGVTAQFVRASLRGDRQSRTSDAILRDYKMLERRLRAVFNRE